MTCARGCCPTPGEHYRSLVISGAPSAQKQAVRLHDADMEAYRRLRADGYQPPTIAGSAALEKAAHVPFEIESGRLTRNRRLAREVQQIADVANDPATFTPLPGTTPVDAA